MESLMLDDSGDLVISENDIQLAEGISEIEQTFRTLLRTSIDEWFMNSEMGFDYSVVKGVKRINEQELESALQKVADQMEGIDRIEDLIILHDRPSRYVSIKCTAITVDGIPFAIEEVF